ncbi:MAG: hypothetical protein AAF316_00360 [Cyanobacteria bacterium P01_A01_bin.80]
MKHDLLKSKDSKVQLINAEIKNNYAVCGYALLDACDKQKVIVTSGIGDSYLIVIPEQYLNVPSGSQFNVSFQVQKVESTFQKH